MTIYATDAERPIAGNQYVPDSMEARGRLRPIVSASPSVRNGLGELVGAGPDSYEWTFSFMNQTEINWWKTLIGYDGKAESRSFSKRFVYATLPAARLWDVTGELIDYQVAVIDIPTWESYSNSLYRNVTVRFSVLIPQQV